MRKPNIRRARPSNASREIAPLPWSYLVVLAICGCVLAAGFFLAARQHFASMELGMKNSQLRKQLEDLESENRRLLLAREISLSPAEITKTARNLGFLEINAPVVLPVSKPDKPVKAAAQIEKATPIQATPVSLTMTSYQRPVKAASSEPAVTKISSAKQTKNPAKQPKKPETAKQKPVKPELTAIAKR
jgi:hypothetical protein